MSARINPTTIINELMAASVGGAIRCSSIIDNEIYIHCWDGKRFIVSLKQIENGCKFDYKTGEPIPQEVKL